jgi:pimeloyl-ACP methyl ester carboxylesterase
MVDAQYRLMTEGLGIRHLRLVLGNSMGGMQAWIWASRYPKAMDAVVPMASMPVAMSGRNWMLRRLLTESIRNDPENDQKCVAMAAFNADSLRRQLKIDQDLALFEENLKAALEVVE